MSPKAILIVEDDRVLGELTHKAFVKRGYIVYWAETLLQADSLCTSQHFDLALLDLKLEHENSLKLIPKLKNVYPNIKIVMLTGYASIATTVEAMKLGAINYLPKPATTHEILVALEELDTITNLENPDNVMSPKRLEWEHIQRIMARNNDNISAASRELNMHRRTLQRKLQKKPLNQ